MATYVQGVNNVIPQIQPFQPDLNFYANALGTKQNQYDSNWKALSNMYGQFYYADLTRDSSIEKKDHLIKDIDFNMKRVAGLDLSLEQNVNQATQVFKPFYEDKSLMKDMAWTKNYKNSRGRAEGLKNAEDEKMRSQYWENGVKALDYQREEFKETTDEESLGFGNVNYTPYVNTMKEAMKMAKEAGLSIETVDFSPDGKWIIKQKNGQPLMAPLHKLFEATLGNDPGVQAVYKTQAYVNRKDYAYINSAQFGGDKNAAELDYLEKNFNMLKKMNTQQLNETKDAANVSDSRIRDIDKQIKNGTASPEARTYLESLHEAQRINNTTLKQSEDTNELLSDGSSTTQTSSGFNNPYGDIKSLRYKVDAGMASLLMQKDLGEAAYIFAHQNMSTDIQANPYKVLEIKHANNMKAIKAKEEADLRNLGIASGLKTGALSRNALTGEIEINRAAIDGYSIFTSEGASTKGGRNMFDLGKRLIEDNYQDDAKPFTEGVISMVGEALNNGTAGAETLKEIFKDTINLSDPGKFEAFKRKFKERGFEYVDELARRHNQLNRKEDFYANLAKNTEAWMTTHSKLSAVEANYNKIMPHLVGVKDYGANLNSWNEWKTNLNKEIRKNVDGSSLFFDKEHNLLDFDEAMNRIKTASPFFKEALLDIPSISGALYDSGAVGPVGAVGAAIYDFLSPHSIIKGALEDKFKDLYDNTINAMTSAKYAKKLPPFISKGGTGLSSTRVGYQVLPKVWPSAGVNNFHEFARNFKALDLDQAKNVISLNGVSKQAYNNALASSEDDFSQTAKGRMILNDLISQMNSPVNKLDNFSIEAQAIAGDDSNLSAFIVKPTKEFLDRYKSGKDDPAGLSTTDIQNMVTHGISVIGESTNQIFKTSMFNSYLDPIAAQVESRDSYVYKDPRGEGRVYSIKKDGYGGYIERTDFHSWDPQSGTFKPAYREEQVSINGDLVGRRNQMMQTFDMIAKQNKALSNGG